MRPESSLYGGINTSKQAVSIGRPVGSLYVKWNYIQVLINNLRTDILVRSNLGTWTPNSNIWDLENSTDTFHRGTDIAGVILLITR
jgi:hypothetical protein